MANEQVQKIVESLQNPEEPAITIQVNKEGRILVDYKLPEGAGINADDLAFMAANLVIAAKNVVGNARHDVIEQGLVEIEVFDHVMRKYLEETPESPEEIDPMSR